MQNKILSPYVKESLAFKNHLVMAPMTRSRAINNIPNELMCQYYKQRTGAGLIITEGTSPTPEGLGYPRIPGAFSDEQINGWKPIAEGVHKGGSKIFMQFMHTGRIGHEDNLPEGLKLVSASSLKAAGKIFTDTKGLQDHTEPVALTTQGVKEVIRGHVTAANNAIEAGFDGVELHGANGYLIEQFLNPNCNNRADQYGGSIEGRCKIVIELAEGIAAMIGNNKVAIRVSPYLVAGDLQAYDVDEVHATYTYLAKELNNIGIAYMHVLLAPKIEQRTLDAIKEFFTGTIIYCNGFTPESAEEALLKERADLIAFGRSFLANPDLDKRIAENKPLNQPDFTTFYTPGAKGYTDYPLA